MNKTVGARGNTNGTAMPIQSGYDPRMRKKNAQRRKGKHSAEYPDRNFAALVQQFLQRVRTEITSKGGQNEKPNANADEHGQRE